MRRSRVRSMDKDLLQRKLEMLIHCLDRIRSHMIETLEELESNLDKQESIILNLQWAVQICIDIGNHLLQDYSITPVTMADTFNRMAEKKLITETNANNMEKAVAFRNIALHQYDLLDNKIVLTIIKEHLQDFEDFAETVSKL